jgi:hypothetical protein
MLRTKHREWHHYRGLAAASKKTVEVAFSTCVLSWTLYSAFAKLLGLNAESVRPRRIESTN